MQKEMYIQVRHWGWAIYSTRNNATDLAELLQSRWHTPVLWASFSSMFWCFTIQYPEQKCYTGQSNTSFWQMRHLSHFIDPVPASAVSVNCPKNIIFKLKWRHPLVAVVVMTGQKEEVRWPWSRVTKSAYAGGLGKQSTGFEQKCAWFDLNTAFELDCASVTVHQSIVACNG